MSYVNYMSYVSYTSYVSYVSYLGRLYELYELCKLYEYFMNCLKITCKHLKLVKIAWNIIFFVFKKSWFFVCEYIRVENLNYKNENIERKYLNSMQKDQFLKVNNSLLELEKYFIELKDRELKDREVKI